MTRRAAHDLLVVPDQVSADVQDLSKEADEVVPQCEDLPVD
jgi:hypothetical protein